MLKLRWKLKRNQFVDQPKKIQQNINIYFKSVEYIQ